MLRVKSGKTYLSSLLIYSWALCHMCIDSYTSIETSGAWVIQTEVGHSVLKRTNHIMCGICFQYLLAWIYCTYRLYKLFFFCSASYYFSILYTLNAWWTWSEEWIRIDGCRLVANNSTLFHLFSGETNRNSVEALVRLNLILQYFSQAIYIKRI